MLELQNISRKVGDEVYVDDVSLCLQRGELNILLGPTLAGKTSLMRIMAGLDKPDSGSLRFDGRDVLGLPVQKRNVAMVYQQFINYPTLTVFDNIASPLTVNRISKSEIASRVAKVSDLLKLGDFLQRRPDTLSGGQQQRVALARALIKGADLVILDEPLANLDYKLREDLRAELPGLFAEMGAVLVYATTEPTEALVLGGNTACMFEGKVEQFGPTLELYRQPAGLQTARIFSDPPLNTLRLHYRQGELRIPESEQLIKLRAELNDGQDYTLGVRPHHLCLVRRSPEDIELRGEVTVTEIGGSESFVHFEFQNRAWVALIHGIVKFASSEAVSFFVQPRHSLLFDQSDSLISNSTAMIMAP